MSEILRDIEKEIKRERWLQLWQTYRSQALLGLGGALLILFIGLSLFWFNKQQAEKASVDFDYALGLGEGSLPLLEELAKAGGIYGALADFQRANHLAKQGKKTQAAKIYEALIEHPALTPPLRDLALLYSAQTQFGRLSYEAMEKKLAPLMAEGNVLRTLAVETLALTAVVEKKSNEAKKLLTPLIEDPKATDSLRVRARILLDRLANE